MFGAPANNPRASVLRTLGFQGHHIVPKEIIEKDLLKIRDPELREEITNARQLVTDAGFPIESMKNYVFLPDGKVDTDGHLERTIHRGSHPDYTKRIAKQLSSLHVQAERDRWTPEQKLAAIKEVTTEARQKLKGRALVLNRAIDHSLSAKDSIEASDIGYVAHGYQAEKTVSQQELGGVDFLGGIIQGLSIREGPLNIAIKLDHPEQTVPQITPNIVNTLFDELILLYYVHGRLPNFALETRKDHMMAPLTPATGFIREVMQECDYFMKAFYHQAAFLERGQQSHFQLSSQERMTNSVDIQHAYRQMGARFLREDRFYGPHMDAFGQARESFLANQFEKTPPKLGLEVFGQQHTVYQGYGEVILHPELLVMQHGKGQLKGQEAEQDFEFWSSDGQQHLQMIKEHLGDDPRKKFYFECLKILSSLVNLVQTFKHQGFIPQLSESFTKFERMAMQSQPSSLLPPLAVDMEQGRNVYLFGGAGIRKQTLQAQRKPYDLDTRNHLKMGIRLERWDEQNPLYGVRQLVRESTQESDPRQIRATYEKVYGSQSVTTKDAFVVACELGHADMARHYLKSGSVTLETYKKGLIYAADAGKLSSVKACVEAVGQIDAQHNGWTALQAASMAGHFDIVTWLLVNGANPDITKDGKNACLLAIEHGQKETASQLMSYSRPLNLKKLYPNGELLFKLLWENKLDVIPLALRLGIPVNVQDEEGRTPLIIAMCSRHQELVQQLRDCGADVDPLYETHGGISYLVGACRLGNETLVQELMEANLGLITKRDEPGWTPLLHATFFKHVGVMRQLLSSEQGQSTVNVGDHTGNTPAHFAARDKEFGIIQLMHDYGANVFQENNDGETAFDLYHKKQQEVHIGPVRCDGKTVNRDSCSGCQSREREAYIRSAQQSIEERFHKQRTTQTLDQKNEVGKTLLMEALQLYKETSIDRFLAIAMDILDAGASPHIDDDDGNMASFLMISGHTTGSEIKVIDKLFEKGLDINHQNRTGETVLMKAFECENDDLIVYFLKKGASPHLTNKQGQNVLMTAAEKGQAKWVEYLVRKHRVDIRSVDVQGENAFIKAFKNGHRTCLKFI